MTIAVLARGEGRYDLVATRLWQQDDLSVEVIGVRARTQTASVTPTRMPSLFDRYRVSP